MPRIIEVYGEKARISPVPLGSSIHDFMVAQNPELKNFPLPTVAGYIKPLAEGQKIPTENDIEAIMRADWHKPLAQDDTIVLVAILKPLGGGGGGGGGSGGVVQAVLGAVMVVCAALMWWNPLGWASIAALSGTFLASMALTGGVLLLSGLMGMQGIQPKSISAETYNEGSSPTYSINATSNQARLLQPIPEGFGKIMCTPDIVANPYTTYEGNDQYMYAVYGIGRGEYVVHELYFGDDCFWRDGKLIMDSSLVSSADDVAVQILKPGDKVTLFPDNVESNSNVSQVQLFHKGHPEYSGWMGPYSSPPSGTQAQMFQFDFLAPRGVGWFADNGHLDGHSVNAAIEYRTIDDNGNPTGDWKDGGHWGSGWMATLTPQRWSHFLNLPMGRYEFRVENINTSGSDDHNSKPVDELYLDGLRAYLPGTLSYNQSCIAIKVRATNNLSNNASQQFRCLYTRKLPVWNQSTRKWSAPQETRRFDAAIAAMCKADWGGRLTDDRIDLDALYYCQKKCDEHGWNFDAYIDTAYSVLELITQACAPYRVFPRLIADKISFIYDEPNRPVKHIFTPRDIRRGTLQPSWAVHTQLTPDDIIVSYLDEDVNYARREVDCVLPDSLSQNPKYIQFPIGVCSRQLAHDYGIYTAACNRYRRVKVEFGTEAMSRLLYIGDVISIQHPRLRAIGFGKVTDWNEPYLRVFVDTADCDFDPITRRSLWAAFNKPDGSTWGPVRLTKYFNGYMQFNKSDYEAVVKQQGNPFSWFDIGASSQPTTFALLSGKNIDRRFIIQRINFEDLNHATITAMNDDDRVYNQVVPVPPWTYRNVNSSVSELAYPANIYYTRTAASQMLNLGWSSVIGAESYTLFYQDYIFNDAGQITHVGDENVIRNITRPYIDIPYSNFLKGKMYRFRARAVAGTLVGTWSKFLSIIANPGDDD